MLSFLRVYTWFGSIVVLLPCAFVIGVTLQRMQRIHDAILLLGGLGGASILVHLLKLVFARPRPQVDEMLVAMPNDFSFPSAHTAQAVAFALAFAMVISKNFSGVELYSVWILLAFTAGLLGYSRIYLKVHYISDVIAGAVLGIIWVLLFAMFIKKIV